MTGRAGSSGETGQLVDTQAAGEQEGIHCPGGTFAGGSPLCHHTGRGIQTQRALSLDCSESANTASEE